MPHFGNAKESYMGLMAKLPEKYFHSQLKQNKHPDLNIPKMAAFQNKSKNFNKLKKIKLHVTGIVINGN